MRRQGHENSFICDYSSYHAVIYYGIADSEDLKTLQKQKDWYIVKRHPPNYHLAKHEDGKSIRSFKVDAVVDAPLVTLASVHFDVANIKKWFGKPWSLN